MTETMKKQKQVSPPRTDTCDIMDRGIAGINENLKTAESIISQYWMKYNANDGYWYAKVPNPKKGGRKTAIKRRQKADLEKAILEAHYRRTGEVAAGPTMSFKDLYPIWRAYKIRVREHMESTAIRNDCCYRKYLKNADWIEQDISTIRPNDIRKWMKIMVADKAPTKHDFTNLHGIVNGVFLYALDEGIVDTPITPFIAGIGRNSKLFTPMRSQLPEYDETQVYSKEEAEKVLEQLQWDHLVDLGIRLIFWTGLRIGELLALRWEDISEDYSEILVRRRVTSKKVKDRYIHPVVEGTKGKGVYRRVLVPPNMLEPILRAVKTLNPDGEYIFSTMDRPMTQASFASRLRRICRWAGVDFKSLHKIRKTVVTELMDHHLPMPLIQSQVGHASSATTENCYHFNNKTKKENGRKVAIALTDFLPLTVEA